MSADLRPYTRPLSDAGGIEGAGGKGANLGELVRAGFPVPDGFVVTTAAYDRFVTDNDLGSRVTELAQSADSTAIRALFDQAALPSDLAGALDAAYASLGGPVAVRSSATAEDLPGASFAGQQETFLNVIGADAVRAAVIRCWASLWTERAVAYRAQLGAVQGLSMAVVVQRLVPAEVAGVLFTADPSTGRRDDIVITAAWGLGEAVVGGAVETDEYVVRGDSVESRIAAKSVMTVMTASGTAQAETPADQRRRRTLTDDQARELAALGRRVAEHFGAPQDIEWVLAGGGFQLVQARPITALPDPPGDVPTAWPVPRPHSLYFRASIVEQMPEPLTPLFADMVRIAVPTGLLNLMRELAPTISRLDVDFPTINGYAFYDYSWAAMGSMMSFTRGALRLILTKGYVLDRWRERELPRYRDSVAAWSSRDARTMPAADLLRATQDLLDAGCLYYTTVQTIIPVASMAELTWTGLHDRLLAREGGPAASDYLLGFDSAPIAAEKSLASLAAWCLQDAALTEALTSHEVDPLGGQAPPGVHAARWGQWRERLDAHLSEFGHMTYNLDIANPVPADDPAPVLQALRHALRGRASDPFERQSRLTTRREAITRELLGRLDPARRAVAEKRLGSAQMWGPIREDALAAMGLAWPTMRRMLRELGRRLVDTEVLSDADDVFWLRLPEAASLAATADSSSAPTPPATSAPGGAGLRDEIAERKKVWRGQALATPPQYLPESSLMKSLESMMPAMAGQQGPVLKGTTGSGGRVTGPARVLVDPHSFGDFQPGEVLVASITTPAYTPLFALAGGVVTDIGGVLSHGSIVAREYGIPAVLGTGNATHRIRTGDQITVDGVRGEVLLPGGPADTTRAPDEARDARITPALASFAGMVAGVAVVLLVLRRRRHRRSDQGRS